MRSPAAEAGRDPVLLAIAAVAAVLLLWNLGGRFLWQDEAETALLAKSVLRSGLPIASDGTNVVSQEAGREFGPDFLWRWSPWVQFYLAAGSIALLGPSPLAARLPFALLGLLAVPAIYLLSRRLFGSLAVARLSALLLALSVPFLLHARQARWHSPAYLLLIGLLFAVDGMARRERLAPAALVVAGTLLFYTNYFIAIGALVALLAAAPALRLETGFLARLTAALVSVGILCLPGIIFFRVFGRGETFEGVRALDQLWGYFGSYLTFLMPLPILGVVGLVAAGGPDCVLREDGRRRVHFLLAFSLAYLLYLSLAPWMMFRYLSLLLPPAAMLLALAVRRIHTRSRAASAAVLLLLVFTNVLHMTPLGFAQTAGTVPGDRFPALGLVSSPISGYLYELTHRFDDPEAILCRYLNEHARPGDVVLITYGDLPLQLCSRLTVAGGLQGRQPPADPDWIIVRRFVMSADPGKDLDVVRFIQDRIDLAAYEQVDLGAADTRLGNNPDPAFHLFRPPENAPPILLLRRTRGG